MAKKKPAIKQPKNKLLGTPFFRLSGSGNDFLAFVDPTPAPDAQQIQSLCQRGVSVGADGILHLTPVSSTQEVPTVRVRYWNADGSPGELCFNGTRSAAQLARHLGWCERFVSLATDAATFQAQIDNDHQVAIEAPLPHQPQPFVIDVDSTVVKGWSIRVGVPHVVIPTEFDLQEIDVQTLGRSIRRHEQFAPEGTNVNFVQFQSQEHGSTLSIRTFERGVEAETLACGSGVVASSWVGLSTGALRLPIVVRNQSGLPMRLDLVSEGLVSEEATKMPASWTLKGDARVVASGVLESGVLVR